MCDKVKCIEPMTISVISAYLYNMERSSLKILPCCGFSWLLMLRLYVYRQQCALGPLCFQRKGLKGQGHWASDNKLLQKADFVDNRNHNSLISLALPLCLWSQFFFASHPQSLIGQRIGECHYELWHISKLSWIDSNPARLLSLCVHFRFCPVPICAKTYFF